MSDLDRITDRIANAIKEAPPEGEYAVSEKKLRRLARQELTEAEDAGVTVGTANTVYRIKKNARGMVVITNDNTGRVLASMKPWIAEQFGEIMQNVANK